MLSPKYRNAILFVKAVHECQVREIDEKGLPLMAMRFIGKEEGKVISSGVKLPYSVYLVSKLKDGSLMPVDKATAVLAGVKFDETPMIKTEIKDNK